MRHLLLLLLLTAVVSALDIRECARELGMGSGRIADRQLSASSSYDADSTGPQHARAGRETGSGAWCPAEQISTLSTEWLQIDLDETTVLTAIKTQGRYDHGRGNEFAHSYRVEYWRKTSKRWHRLFTDRGTQKSSRWIECIWMDYLRGGVIALIAASAFFIKADLARKSARVFEGNRDTRSLVLSHVGGGVVVDRVRIIPVSNTTRTVCIRVELIGCPYRDSLVSYTMPEGDSADGLDLADFRFDGEKRDGWLWDGLGKLFDGEVGSLDHESHPHKWIGWRGRSTVSLDFAFASPQNLSAIQFHTSNYARYNAQPFTSITVEFSPNGKDFSSRVLSLDYEPDDFENLRWIAVDVQPMREAKAVRVHLRLPPPPRWLILSEVEFEMDGVAFTHPSTDHDDPTVHVESGRGYGAWFYLLLSLSVLSLLLLAILFIRRREPRVKSSSPPLVSKTYQIIVEDGTLKHVSPSTYAMARDNMENAMIEKTPMDDESSEYAEPGSSDYKEPLLLRTAVLHKTNTLPSTMPPTGNWTSPLSSHGRCATYDRIYMSTLPEINRGQLQYVRELGCGNFGRVFLCRLEKRLVAVKSLHARDQEGEEAFEREMRLLGTLKHPNVVEVIGICSAHGNEPPCCVMQYMARGDLKKYMQGTPSVDSAAALSMCAQIAAGMSYLESQAFVHRDLAARNCLLDDELTVRIGDFGMARSLYAEEYYAMEGTCKLPVRWMSPECMAVGKYSTASDVWSFAVTVWEVLSRCSSLPYPSLKHEEAVQNIVDAHSAGFLETPLPRPPLCPEYVYRDLLIPCWQIDPCLRPTFQAIHHYLQSVQHRTLARA